MNGTPETGDRGEAAFEDPWQPPPLTVLPAAEPEAAPRQRYGALNIVVIGLQIVLWWGLITAAGTVSLPWPARILAVVVFCFVMQGVFSMMHECFHRNAHPSKLVNDLLCWVGATMFGTSATLHRIHHWGHHLRNRSASERGEYIHPGENPAAKTFLYYFAVCGGLYIASLAFSLLILILPYATVRLLTKAARFNTYSAAWFQFKPRDWWQIRIETLASAAVWFLVLRVTHWELKTLLLCYIPFAFTWSSLQWVYHLRTPIHAIEGAYNLRLPLLARWSFLNFNYNLTHHRNPHLPWQDLYAASNQQETQPLWYRWLMVFLPPEPFPKDLQPLEKRYL